MTDSVVRLLNGRSRTHTRNRIVIGIACVIIGSLLATGHASAQALPMTPAVQQALRDSTLVRKIPGRFQVKNRGADHQETVRERTTMETHLNGIVALLRRDPAVAPPVGIDAVAGIETGITETGNGVRMISGVVNFVTWPYMVDDKRVGYNNALSVEFHVNDDICSSGDPVVPGSKFFLARLRTSDYHGYPTLDSVVVITHRIPPPCIAVSREDFLNGMARAMSQATTVDPAEAAAAKRDQEATLREMARTNPKLAAQERAQIASIQRTTDSVAASLTGRYMAPLARMSPAERSSAAYMVEDACADKDNGCLVSPGTSGARMVVRPNPAFFDPSRPADAQLITVDLRHVLDEPNPPDPFIVELMSRALSQFDWGALGDIVR